MRAIAVVLLVLPLAAGTAAAAEEKVPIETLLGFLDHDDPAVVREAEIALVERGPEAMAPAAKAGAERVRRALVLAGRLGAAPAGSVSFWMAFEEVFLLAPPHLVAPVLRVAIPDPARLYDLRRERERARETVRFFCLEWNETWAQGSPEKTRYDELQKELEAAGAAAVPHLLRVLDRNDRKVFGVFDHRRGITARMQVRAIFGISFLKAREALPHLLVHSSQMSYTAAVNAGAAFETMTYGRDLKQPFAKPDAGKMIAWWKEHRAELAPGVRWLARAIATDLHRSVAAEVVGRGDLQTLETKGGLVRVLQNPEDVLGPKDQARSVKQLELLTGETFPFDEAAPVGTRLGRAREIAARIDALAFP